MGVYCAASLLLHNDVLLGAHPAPLCTRTRPSRPSLRPHPIMAHIRDEKAFLTGPDVEFGVGLAGPPAGTLGSIEAPLTWTNFIFRSAHPTAAFVSGAGVCRT